MSRIAFHTFVTMFLAACGGATSRAPAVPIGNVATAPAPTSEPELPPAAPPGYLEMHADQVVMIQDGAAVLLGADDEPLQLPIFIGGTEGHSIELRLTGSRAPRPLTHDLLDRMLDRLGGTIAKVQVDRLTDGVFHGSVHVRASGKLIRFDARPSDAIALAIGAPAPIFVARAVLDEAGVPKQMLQPPTTPTPST